jgi:signal transduction histidine kinase/HAMP domain-containing protein/ActR/RegA family two-component response regulator
VSAVERGPNGHLASEVGDGLDQVALLGVLAAVKSGDFSVRMPLEWTGVAGKIADYLNDVIAANQTLGIELTRVSRVVGKEGRLSQRIPLRGSDQVWAESIESVNSLIDDIVRPTSEMQRVIGAVADGDLSKKITADVHGEMLELKSTINAMVDQLNRFISEVTRVAREVGTEGKLGQAAAVTIEVAGVWKDLTDNVNLMAGNLTGQVRNIAEVTTAVANGDLSKKITADVKGEFLELKDTVNAMVDQLNRFASEVTRVAREVGVEGKLGGQAQSAEVAGVWKDLTDNVNQLAANLTNQVRAIADVATAVTEGDLTRQVGVEASGEVAVLKDKLNEMIRNLRETTRQNTEQDWLKTNLERFTRMLQGQRDLATVSNMVLSELAPLVSAQHGVFYTLASLTDGGEPVLQYQAGYGYKERKHLAKHFAIGEGLVGQCAKEKERILLTDVPGDYVVINSGLGESPPLNIIVLPILFEGAVRAVVELASLSRFSPTHQAFLDQLTESIGLVLNTIEANTLTENLLKQSQSQAQELQSRQQQLHSSNDDLGRQAERLAEKNIEVERKNEEVELAKRMVEEKAEQLAISSRYKSEFFSNMSHELRTPLNSLLILASELEGNPEKNLTEAQVQYASVIHSSGIDLLRLLNDILDLAKVESGTVTLDISELTLTTLTDALELEYGEVANQQGLAFALELAPDLPPTITTDAGRLRQVLKNLLSNAFKFTERGEVSVRVSAADSGWSSGNDALERAEAVIAFSVADSGIGITAEMQRSIFEAFAQGDGTAARQYAGTGLGLSICRELARLLGGEIALTSTPDQGSTFTVYLPSDRAGAVGVAPRRPMRTRSPAAQSAQLQMNRAPAMLAAAARSPADSADLMGAKILVVDDDFRNIFALTALLERNGAVVVSAENGHDGVELFSQTPDVDIVLMDTMMPVMDGYETTRAIRRLPERGDVPIIAVTAKVGEGERQLCLDAGATDYISKPVDTAGLLRVLGQWVPIAVLSGPRSDAAG